MYTCAVYVCPVMTDAVSLQHLAPKPYTVTPGAQYHADLHVMAKVPLERYFSYYVVCCVNQLLLILKAHLWLSND